MNNRIISHDDSAGTHTLVIKGYEVSTLAESFIVQHTSPEVSLDSQEYKNIWPLQLALNNGEFINQYNSISFPAVTVRQEALEITVSCTCLPAGGSLCEHQAQVLIALIKRDDLRTFFDETLRFEKLKKFALDYGMERETDLDRYFQVQHQDKKLHISARLPTLLPVNKASLNILKELIIPVNNLSLSHNDELTDKAVCVVLKQHKYYKNLLIDLYQAPTTKDGKIKNPLSPLSPLNFIWQTDDKQELKYYTGINAFQNVIDSKKSDQDFAALRAIINNPLNHSFYYHNNEVSENVTAASVVPVHLHLVKNDIVLNVSRKEQFYELGLSLKINDETYDLKDLILKFTYFLSLDDQLFLVDNLQTLALIELIKKKTDHLLIHESKYKEFNKQLLAKLEDNITIDYQHIKPANPHQLEREGFNSEAEKIIYLSDFGSQVMIIPVMRYGEAEIPIRTRRQIYGVDEKGNEFLVKRNNTEEIAFTALLIRQHPFFEEQVTNDLHYFYLHKKRFLEEEWFLNAFEEWENHQITILGFNEITGNKLNPHKIKITIHVISGINWFNTIVNARFGKTKASLKQVHKAIRNKSKFVKLDDGSLGILPADWIEKFTNYFNAGEIADEETIRIPKINFTAIEQFFEESLLDEAVKNEINIYQKRLADFESIKEVEVPEDLLATLRPYQKKGLDWLNFLDDFNFGGCLADDMGLGKTIQIIAFILSLRGKSKHNTNLLIVPTSLIYNWQSEVAKFAPSIRILTIYGANRTKSTKDWHQYEAILTTYGTLLSDVGFLKAYEFNYIFLDESQNIKNPESQRYKAVRSLNSRNKITITGTPIENNTFDVFGQLSFACPGLLGSKQYFRDIYSSPIDKFKDSKRAVELHNKIKPFILRRTKHQVATELPDKTEMVLFCEMKEEQRKIYNTYEKEIREYISATDNEVLRKNPMNVLKGLTKLRQICDSPVLMNGEKLPGNESAKIDTLIEEIESKLPNHKILVFSQFVSMLDLIRKELIQRKIGFAYLTGQTRNRDVVINDFQNNAETRVFLISLKAGGTGLNLTEADYVYLVDPWWNPAVENQAIDRCHRIGQHKNIVAVRLICPGTVEEKIMKLQDSKKELMDDLIKSDTSFMKSFSKEELLSLFE
ncbi:MAG: ATP-dependent helicase [Sphingobacteriales bacterium]|nr:ATP-dependent helicase [Sphingobacteriales bacterium]